MTMQFFSATWLKRYLLLILLGLVFTLPLGSCSLDAFRTASAKVSEYATSTLSDPKSFNYALSNEFPNIFIFTHAGLVDENGQTGELMPDLAESWEISEDKTHIIFTLREGLKWSDGQPLTADDVVFSFNDIYLNEKVPTPARDGLRIGEKGILPTVKKLSDRRIDVTTFEPFAPIVRQMSAPILPAHILRPTVEKTDENGNPIFLSTWGTDTDPKKIVVAGPYVMEEYVPSQRIVYRRNPYYWRKSPDGTAQPYVDRIVWQLVDSTDNQIIKFRSGDLDMVTRLSPQEFSLLKREEKRGDFTIYEGGPRSGTNFISFNLNPAKQPNGQPIVDPIKLRWFSNKTFRQAVAYAINRPKMLNNVFRGIGDLQHSPVSVQSPYYFSPQEGLKTYDYDPNKAKELLKSAGFKYNNNGQLLDDKGNPVRFTLITNAENKLRVEMSAQIKQDLSEIGMQVDFAPISFNSLIEKMDSTRDWDCLMLGFTGGVDPHSGSNLWTSRGSSHFFNQSPQPGQPPIKAWVAYPWEKEIDQLFLQGAREFDEAKRKAIYARYQEIVQDELPQIFLVTPKALSAIRNTISNVKYSGLDPREALWNLYELQVTSKAAA